MKLLSTIRVLALLSATTFPLCWPPRMGAAEEGVQDVKNSAIEGTVYTVDSDGNRFEVPAALVRLSGPSFSQETVPNSQGRYSFLAVATNTYQIDAMAPGLTGSNTVTFVSGTAVVVPAQWLKYALDGTGSHTAGPEAPVLTHSCGQSGTDKQSAFQSR